jgi:hypothetical protein
MDFGLIALVPRLQTERGRHLFYEGPDVAEEGDLFLTWISPRFWQTFEVFKTSKV